MPEPLHILALSDGRPGHFNKTRALIRAISLHRTVKVEWLEFRLRSGMLRPVLSALIQYTSHPGLASTLGWFFTGANRADTHPDLIVSSGGNTLYANASLARAHRCPNIFIGSLRHYPTRAFWLVITHKTTLTGQPFVYWPHMLVDILPDEINAHGLAFIQENNLIGQRLWALLLGGDGGGYHYDSDDIARLAQLMRRTHHKQGVRWLVVSSRRTGIDNETRLAALLDPQTLAFASWASQDGSNHYHAMLGAAERVVCTEDSQMMLAEAVAAGKPTLSVRPAQGQPDDTDFLPHYAQTGWISRQTLEDTARNELVWAATFVQSGESSLYALGARLTGLCKSANAYARNTD